MTHTTSKRDLADKIAEKIFANGADRLALEKNGRDLGGWCRQAVVDQIATILEQELAANDRI